VIAEPAKGEGGECGEPGDPEEETHFSLAQPEPGPGEGEGGRGLGLGKTLEHSRHPDDEDDPTVRLRESIYWE
jgi:hypothetical protein